LVILIMPTPPRTPPFPFTTRFRSESRRGAAVVDRRDRLVAACRPDEGCAAASRRVALRPIGAPGGRGHRDHRPVSENPCLHGRRSEEHTPELQSRENYVRRLLLEK